MAKFQDQDEEIELNNISQLDLLIRRGSRKHGTLIRKMFWLFNTQVEQERRASGDTLRFLRFLATASGAAGPEYTDGFLSKYFKARINRLCTHETALRTVRDVAMSIAQYWQSQFGFSPTKSS